MRFREPTNVLLYVLASLAKRVALLYRSFRLIQVDVEDLLSGTCLIYIGEGESLGYIRETYFEHGIETKTNTLPLWGLNKRVKQLASSNVLIFVEINRILKSLIPPRGLLTFPWVRQRVSLNSNDYMERRRKIDSTFGRKVRKFHYRFQITRDKELVKRFYEKLYLPYVTTRFENTYHARTLSELQAAIYSGFLLQVFAQDLWVSGAICKLKKDEICTLAFGHLPNDQYDLRWGGLSTAYYFIFKWAEENSMLTVNLLRSRPNTSDGVYEHKRRWGAKPEIDSWPHTALWIFIPEEIKLPSSLKKQLVWDRNGFAEIEETFKFLE